MLMCAGMGKTLGEKDAFVKSQKPGFRSWFPAWAGAMNGKSNTSGRPIAFALMYRRANRNSYEHIKKYNHSRLFILLKPSGVGRSFVFGGTL